MPKPPPRTILLLLSVAAVSTLLVGLVGSVDRTRSQPPLGGFVADGDAPEPERDGLRVPIVLPPLEVPAAARPAPRPAPSAEPAPERPRLVGLVLRPDGEPASGARVVLGQQHERCDPEGRFALDLPPNPDRSDLLAFEPGYEPALRSAFGAGLARRGETQVRLVLGPETLTLAGTVVGPDGQPLKNWNIELDELDPLQTFGLRERVRTDGAGLFVLSDVPAGIHIVRAWRERPDLAFRSEPVAAGTNGLVILADPR